jgi:hypothetical protein
MLCVPGFCCAAQLCEAYPSRLGPRFSRGDFVL